jgi:pimeloyl-ACP methyl ester carboxylesterase
MRSNAHRTHAVALSILGHGMTACAASTPAIEQETVVMETTSKDGTRLAYWRSGSGPPLLLVHGTTADHTRWAGVLPELEKRFTVYAMDRRGRGGSGDAPDYAIEREFEDVAAVIEAIGEPVAVLAHSYGAVCSLEAALLTDRVRRVILYEPPIPVGLPQYPPGVPERVQSHVDAGDLEAGLETFFREVVRMPDGELAIFRTRPVWRVRVTLAPTIPREMTLDRSYAFRAERFANFTVPTLLLLGGDSPPIFRQPAELLDAVLPDSRLVVLEGQQHVAMDTAPEMFLEKVLAFLGRRAG